MDRHGEAGMVATGRRLGTPPHPGEVLFTEYLQPLGMAQVELAERLGVSWPRLNGIVAGKRPVTLDTALRLARVLGAPGAMYWLKLQAEYDLWRAQHSPDVTRRHRVLRPLPLGAAFGHDVQ